MKFSYAFISILFIVSFMIAGLSCKRNNDQPAENLVYYYPEKNIYFDSRQSSYYYSLDSTATWDSMVVKTPGYATVLGPKIPVRRMGNNVWANNAADRKAYKGVVLNIINNHTISLARADRINKLRAVVKKETQPKVIEKEAPAEKGIKKFFNKIFGKKKKPAEEKSN